MKKNNTGFTLVEVIVAVAVLSIIMVSVLTGFSIASDVNNRTEVSRAMQNNIKTALEIISEDIRLNDITFEYTDKNGVLQNAGTHKITGNNNHDENDTLYAGTSEYYLGTKSSSGVWTYDEDCYGNQQRIPYKYCSLIKNDGTPLPITNSWVDFTDLKFYVSNKTNDTAGRPKATINFTIRPSFRKGIKPDLIKKNIIKLQTTLNSEYIRHSE
ncbi:MAG: type II secretion system GspH family protein [Candidatus Gracilibacteria bacterium]|nr:type II secretion system GspH family protein [Candidatus Gracilibacteria bacterium]